jgi:hypothetical protein
VKFETIESLKELEYMLLEVDAAITDNARTMEDSDLPEILTWACRTRVWKWESPVQTRWKLCVGAGVIMLLGVMLALASGMNLIAGGVLVAAIAGFIWISWVALNRYLENQQRELAEARSYYCERMEESQQRIAQLIETEVSSDYRRRDYLVMLDTSLQIEMDELGKK